jgi:hypothetical protein
VIGLIPDELILSGGADRLSLLDRTPHRVLSSRLVDHLAVRASREVEALMEVVRTAGDDVPSPVREAVRRLGESLIGPHVRDENTR